MSRRLSRYVSCAKAIERNWSRRKSLYLVVAAVAVNFLKLVGGRKSISCEKTVVPVFTPLFRRIRPSWGGGKNARLHFKSKKGEMSIKPLITSSYVDMRIRQPDISNNVGPVKSFLSTLVRPLPRVVCSFSFGLCVDDHGSVRNLSIGFIPTQTSLRSKLQPRLLLQTPFSGSGMPIKCTCFTSHHVRFRSCPAYERTLLDCEYSQPLRHIQYNRTASLRPIATLAMLLCRRIARCMCDVSRSVWIRAAAWAASTNKKRN